MDKTRESKFFEGRTAAIYWLLCFYQEMFTDDEEDGLDRLPLMIALRKLCYGIAEQRADVYQGGKSLKYFSREAGLYLDAPKEREEKKKKKFPWFYIGCNETLTEIHIKWHPESDKGLYPFFELRFVFESDTAGVELVWRNNIMKHFEPEQNFDQTKWKPLIGSWMSLLHIGIETAGAVRDREIQSLLD